MNRRCNNTKTKSYPRYGGRGIRICDRWSDFALFLADMGERPPGTTLDRKDTDGNYEPSNCRWATGLEQRRNTSLVKLTFPKAVEVVQRVLRGELKKTIAKELGVHPSTISDVCRGKSWPGAITAAAKELPVNPRASRAMLCP